MYYGNSHDRCDWRRRRCRASLAGRTYQGVVACAIDAFAMLALAVWVRLAELSIQTRCSSFCNNKTKNNTTQFATV